MLAHLQIKNFTIITELKLDFDAGMTVLTGETGAGKSIIIDSLELALGVRADTSVIKHGCERCEITAIFTLNNNSPAQKWLKNHELESDNECIIYRYVSIDGRSRNTINGVPFPQQLVRELGSFLVNIHGQNEHQNLLQRNKQLHLLDNFAKHKNLTDEVHDIFNNWQQAVARLAQLGDLNRQAQNDLLSYQIEELNKLNLVENELESLHQENKMLNNTEQIIKTCSNVLNIIGNHNFFDAQNQLQKMQELDPQINSITKLLENAVIQIEEATRELQYYSNNLSIDPDRLQFINSRLNTLYDLSRKHRVKPEELMLLQSSLQQQLDELDSITDQAAILKQKVADLTVDYMQAAAKLSESRRQAASKLVSEVTKQMQSLNMLNSQFNIQISMLEKDNFTVNGLEQIEFLVAINPGQPLLPLSKVVSGGELSRISLAIQVITAQKDRTPTLIFDEVDSGVGGKTAQIVGELLRKLGTKTQVLCVTHLPQVAAQGHNHFQVKKQISPDVTITTIAKLTPSEKINEIARMLGGSKITPQTLAHAKEMCEV